jgi:bisphosphoglycerate-dependent phosphoglycerate mutase
MYLGGIWSQPLPLWAQPPDIAEGLHHDDIENLQSWRRLAQRHYGEASGTDSGALQQAIEEALRIGI